MKKLLVTILLCLILCSCSSTKFYVCGLEVNRDDLNPYTFLGAVSSVGTHILGHYLFAELYGVEIHQEGIREAVDYYETDYDSRWFARGGFVLQSSVNLLLTSFEKTCNSSFTKGYTIMTASHIWSYPLRHKNPEDGRDLRYLDEHGGNSEAEHNLYSAIALYNIFRVVNFE